MIGPEICVLCVRFEKGQCLSFHVLQKLSRFFPRRQNGAETHAKKHNMAKWYYDQPIKIGLLKIALLLA